MADAIVEGKQGQDDETVEVDFKENADGSDEIVSAEENPEY